MKPKHYILSLIILTISIYSCANRCDLAYYITGMNMNAIEWYPRDTLRLNSLPPLPVLKDNDTIGVEELALKLDFSFYKVGKINGCGEEVPTLAYIRRITLSKHVILPSDTLKEDISEKTDFYIPYLPVYSLDYYQQELYKNQGKLSDIATIHPKINSRIILTLPEKPANTEKCFFTVYYEDSEQNVYKDTTITFYLKN